MNIKHHHNRAMNINLLMNKNININLRKVMNLNLCHNKTINTNQHFNINLKVLLEHQSHSQIIQLMVTNIQNKSLLIPNLNHLPALSMVPMTNSTQPLQTILLLQHNNLLILHKSLSKVLDKLYLKRKDKLQCMSKFKTSHISRKTSE
jgi:hypothetical protein